MHRKFAADVKQRNEKSIGTWYPSSNWTTQFLLHFIIRVHNFFYFLFSVHKARHIFSQLTVSFSVRIKCTFDFFRISHSCGRFSRFLFIYVSRIQTHKHHHHNNNLPMSLLLSRSAGVSCKMHKREVLARAVSFPFNV